MSVQAPGSSGPRPPHAASLLAMQAPAASSDREAQGQGRPPPKAARSRSPGAVPAPVAEAVRSRPAIGLRVEEAAAVNGDTATASRIEADIAQLNLSFLHVARELSRSSRELAVTRLGLDANACAALDRLSIADLQALAHSHALIFGLRVDPSDLPLQAKLARTNRIASGARLLLAMDAR
jgi:hypothetical protein